MGVSINVEPPIAGWFCYMENPKQKWMIWVYPHDLGNLHTIWDIMDYIYSFWKKASTMGFD